MPARERSTVDEEGTVDNSDDTGVAAFVLAFAEMTVAATLATTAALPKVAAAAEADRPTASFDSAGGCGVDDAAAAGIAARLPLCVGGIPPPSPSLALAESVALSCRSLVADPRAASAAMTFARSGSQYATARASWRTFSTRTRGSSAPLSPSEAVVLFNGTAAAAAAAVAEVAVPVSALGDAAAIFEGAVAYGTTVGTLVTVAAVVPATATPVGSAAVSSSGVAARALTAAA